MENGSEKKDHTLAISILIAALLIGGSFIYGSGLQRGAGEPRDNNTATVGQTPIDNITADDDVILGDPEAPVTLVVFGDYQCPYCKRMFDETEQQMRKDYIEDGKINMVFRDFPLDNIHPYARSAAEATECARDEGKYWAYHDVLFDRQQDIPSIDFVALAEELGLDAGAFNACVSDRKYKDEVQKDYLDGIAAGVSGTPGTFVLLEDGTAFRFIEGAQPYTVFTSAIEAAFAK